jgi:hypothetical protein
MKAPPVYVIGGAFCLPNQLPVAGCELPVKQYWQLTTGNWQLNILYKLILLTYYQHN